MSTVIRIPPEALAGALRGEGERVREIVKKAARSAAMKLKTYLVRETDKRGITYQGLYKNGFRATDNSVVNDAPHAGLVELGARPHAVSKEGRESIMRWAMIKLGLDPKEAESASWAIANKIRKEGQEGRFIMRDAVPKAVEFYKQELERLLKQARGKKP
jgi:hypothetical protein